MSTRWRAAWRRRHLIAEAGIALMRARLTVLVRRGSRLAAVLGEPVSEAAATPLSPQQLAQAREVGWAIELLAVRGTSPSPADVGAAPSRRWPVFTRTP
jgi:hypothetical protein